MCCYPLSSLNRGLWRRFFELQEQEEKDEQERIVELLEEVYHINSSKPGGPVESEHAIRARREMVSEYYRGLRSETSSSSSSGTENGMHHNGTHTINVTSSFEQQRSSSGWNGETRQPNLDIPVGDFHCSIAQ